MIGFVTWPPFKIVYRYEKRWPSDTANHTRDFAKNLDEGLQTDVILLDFSKAFDKVDHAYSIHKLNFYGI